MNYEQKMPSRFPTQNKRAGITKKVGNNRIFYKKAFQWDAYHQLFIVLDADSQCMLGSQPPLPMHAGKPTPFPVHTEKPTPFTVHAGKPTPPPLWTEGMTHACENITLPQTSFADGNKNAFQ